MDFAAVQREVGSGECDGPAEALAEFTHTDELLERHDSVTCFAPAKRRGIGAISAWHP
jgi:hypothetical protein